jgi:hypothetical protein
LTTTTTFSISPAKERAAIFLTIFGGLLNIYTFYIYDRGIMFGDTKPNISSWGIWSVLTVLNFASYGAMSRDMIKTALPTLGSLLCIFTFCLTLCCGQWKQIGWGDAAALGIGIIAAVQWYLLSQDKRSTTAPMWANMMLQIGNTVGFIATFISVWKNPYTEIIGCWFAWTILFLFQTAVVIIRWKGKKSELVYSVNCFWMHLVVALIAMYRR